MIFTNVNIFFIVGLYDASVGACVLGLLESKPFVLETLQMIPCSASH